MDSTTITILGYMVTAAIGTILGLWLIYLVIGPRRIKAEDDYKAKVK